MSLLRVWGNPSIDLFATSLNMILPLYCSLVPDPQAVFENVFRHHLVSRVVAMTLVDRTPLAREGVVRRLTSTDPTTSRLALVGQSASAAPLQPLPPKRPRAEPSHVATQESLPKVSLFGKGCLSPVRVSQILHLMPLPVEVADLLWLVSWKGHCSSQRHCSSSRGLCNTLTPRQGLVRLCG